MSRKNFFRLFIYINLAFKSAVVGFSALVRLSAEDFFKIIVERNDSVALSALLFEPLAHHGIKLLGGM